MGGVTPIYGIPYPITSDPPTVPAHIQAAVLEVEAELARIDAAAANSVSALFYSTAGTAPTWTKPAGLLYAATFATGCGGGSGGAAIQTGGNGAIASGGGGGGTAWKLFPASSLAATETVTIGTPGAGGAAGTNNGTAGGACSFATGKGYVVTGGGGGLGVGGTSGGALQRVAGGAGGTATGGDVNVPGQAGGIAYNDLGNPIPLNQGGHSGRLYGFGGVVVVGDGNGNVGTGFGAGGSGAVNFAGAATTNKAGAAGTVGLVVVLHYF